MEFGRVPDPSRIDFTLPAEPAENVEILTVLAAREADEPAPRVILGAPVWNHDGFVGRIYPKGTPRREYLHHYARQFPAIELNTSFYGIDASRVARWRSQVPEGFAFCPKLPRTITHDLGLVDAADEVERFAETVRGFGPHLGPCWMQMSPAFAPSSRGALEAFLDGWPPDLRLAVELRHEDWFRDPADTRAALDLLAGHGVAAVLTDVAGRRDVLHMRLTAPFAMIRFAGDALVPSDFTRLDAWAARLAHWLDAGVPEVWFFLHQKSEHETVDLALHLAERLHEIAGVSLRAPRLLPTLRQGTLF